MYRRKSQVGLLKDGAILFIVTGSVSQFIVLLIHYDIIKPSHL